MDTEQPNVARMYDYHLGGAHNFAVDRDAARATAAAMPWVAAAIRANRAFLARAVRYATSLGITQFLDLGSGLPTVGNVHEIARETHPDAHVVYLDSEPVAAAYSRTILAGDPFTRVVHADLRDVDVVLDTPAVHELLDLAAPVALLTVAVLHFVPDADDPAGLLARYRAALAPGSVHVLSHATADHDPDVVAQASDTYRDTSNPITPRTRGQVAAMLGLDTTETDRSKIDESNAEGTRTLAEPGLVDATNWRPDRTNAGEHAGYWAAVAHIR